jgi:hypothetical protein
MADPLLRQWEMLKLIPREHKTTVKELQGKLEGLLPIIETGNESFRFKQSSATANEPIKTRESSLRASLVSENIENNTYE